MSNERISLAHIQKQSFRQRLNMRAASPNGHARHEPAFIRIKLAHDKCWLVMPENKLAGDKNKPAIPRYRPADAVNKLVLHINKPVCDPNKPVCAENKRVFAMDKRVFHRNKSVDSL